MSVMPHKTIRLVCFDLGGVIIRICRTWLEACRRAGLPVRDGIEGVLQREIETRRELNVLHQTGRLDTLNISSASARPWTGCIHPMTSARFITPG